MKVEKTFDQVAKEYDDIKLKVIPGYEDAVRMVLDYVDIKQPRILEIGTGTGSFAAKLLKRFPKGGYAGIDISSRMLEIAAHNLKGYKERVQLAKVDLNQERLKGKYDLVVSFFTIHHIKKKQLFLKDMYKLLDKNGILLYVDIIRANDEELEKKYMEKWKQFMRKKKYAGVKDVINDHLENDIPETAEKQLSMLKRCGFRGHGIPWKHEKFAFFYARK